MFRQFQIRLRRKIQRAFLSDPEKMPQRVALGMATIVLLSIVVTYNILFEKRKEEQNIQTKTVMDLFRERSAKERLEHLELQRTIIQARHTVEKEQNR